MVGLNPCNFYSPLPHTHTHTHTHTHSVVGLWQEDLSQTNPKAAQALADPTEYENLFPELKQALVAEQVLKQERETLRPASDFTVLQVKLLVRVKLKVTCWADEGVGSGHQTSYE